MKNGDAIRAMSDEELAHYHADCECVICKIHDYCFAGGAVRDCEDVWLAWLREEAEK